MLRVIMFEDASTDGMSVGAADTAGVTGTTGTTGTKGTSGPDSKKPIKKILPQVAAAAKAMASPVFQSKVGKLGTMKGSSLAKGIAGIGDAAEDATKNAIENRAEKNNTAVNEPPADLLRNLKVKNANEEWRAAKKAQKAKQELSATGKAPSAETSDTQIKAVSDNAMKVATGQQKPK